MNAKIIGGLALVAIVVFLGFVFLSDSTNGNLVKEDGSYVEGVSWFNDKVKEEALREVGQPIEGFEPNMLMMAFPGLKAEDFEGVVALQGVYSVRGGEIVFTLDKDEQEHSAARAIDVQGMAILLENVSDRSDIGFKTEAEVNQIIAFLNDPNNGDENGDGGSNGQNGGREMTTYENNFGLKFVYPSGESGYRLEEKTSSSGEDENFLAGIVLIDSDDYKWLQENKEATEGPPTMNISIYRNVPRTEPKEWAKENPNLSNWNLKLGAESQTEVSNIPALKYRADGLYVSENYIVYSDVKTYVISGSFIDENSQIRRDFENLLRDIQISPVN